MIAGACDEQVRAMPYYRELINYIGTAIDITGVAVIFVGVLLATIRYLLRRHAEHDKPYRRYRQDMGRAILLGLEFLVAGDIIRTVAISPTLGSVINLGRIVLIRTFLSFSLEVELEGRWPWQRSSLPPQAPPAEKEA